MVAGESRRLRSLRPARDAQSRVLLGTAIARMGLSGRACHRVLKLARTCADLAGHTEIRRIDIAEAVQLRVLDKLTC
jgi:magnesium chelatase family protein